MRYWLILAVAMLVGGCQSPEPPPADPANPRFPDIIANSQHFSGLIDTYRHKETGEIYLRLSPAQLERDYLYFATFVDGLAQNWTQRGVFGSQRVIRLHRDYKVLQFQQVNTGFYFDPDSALARAADANLPPAVLAVADILDENEAGDILVNVGPVFRSEALQQIKPAADPKAEPGKAFALGALSEPRTRLQELRVYPENLEVLVNYVYEDPAPLVPGGSAVADSRYVSVRLQHTLIAAPDGSFEPRREDPRVGYFTDQITDMTDTGPTPWRDPISRWKLVKKNPGAALSEPVEPIVFWLENTTPVEFRDVVRDAVLVWNQAFESAGFKNAIEVKMQPDDAEWDARDLRYNVLRWTSSGESPWGGYGPTWSDPRTGQILGADIMLEFSWIRTFLERDRLFSEPLPGASGVSGVQGRNCQAGALMQSNLQFARALLTVEPGGAAESELLRQSMYGLVSHEVGHVLGLNHNFRASTLLTPDELADPVVVAERGVTASVMDYAAVNYPANGVAQPHYYLLQPGPYDHWAIEYGYSEALSDPETERARLDAILARSTEPALAFGLDADVMAGSDSGIDPRVMMFDLSSDPVAYGERRLQLVASISAELLDRYAEPGASWQALYNAYLALDNEQARQLVVASRWIGGIYVDRAFQGQAGATVPLQPVELARQQRAMALLRDWLFAPDAQQQGDVLYAHLQQQRRGQEQWNKPQDPTLHARVLNNQRQVLEHLLHPVVMARISDSALYGNQYTLNRVLSDLTGAIFDADMRGDVNSLRRQLQSEYVEQLLRIADPASGTAHNHLSRGEALYSLLSIEERLRGRPAGDGATRAHTAALLHRIRSGLERDE